MYLYYKNQRMFLLLFIYLGLFFASLLTIRRAETILNIFFDNNTAINNEIALEEFKSTVRKCMDLALIYGVIILGVLCICIILIWYIGLFSSCISFLLFIFVIRELEQEAVKLQKQARTLNCANSDLEEEYKKICHTWVEKPLPDF